MRANAFKAWAAARTDWEVRIHQTLENTHALYRFGVATYNWIQRTLPMLHHLYFNYLELAAMHRGSGRILGAERFSAQVREFRPDVVLSTHAHLNHGFFDLARRALGKDNVCCVTYCGELAGGYGFSRHWVNPHADLFVGAVQEVTQAATEHGMSPRRARTGGFLLAPGFYEQIGLERRREFVEGELGFDPDAFTLLLATGAVGANNHLRVLEALERRGKPLQVVALCGRNRDTLQRVETWRRTARAVDVKALGYWERMPLLLRSVSAVLARPGTGTTSEAVMCGCPIIMNAMGGVMPQERITLVYARRRGILRVIRRASAIGAILDEWQDHSCALDKFACAVRRQRPRQNPSDILQLVASTVSPPGRAAESVS